MQLRVRVAPAEISEEARDTRRRVVAPSVLAETVGRQVHAEVVAAPAILDRAGDASRGPALDHRLAAREVEAGLHLHVHGAAERIQAEHRITGPGVGVADGDGRDQVPVHGVAESLIQAHAVLIDGYPLRRPLQGRSRKAAKTDVLGEVVALRIGRADAGNALHQGVSDRERIQAREVTRAERLHRHRQLVGIDAGPLERRRRDDVDDNAPAHCTGIARRFVRSHGKRRLCRQQYRNKKNKQGTRCSAVRGLRHNFPLLLGRCSCRRNFCDGTAPHRRRQANRSPATVSRSWRSSWSPNPYVCTTAAKFARAPVVDRDRPRRLSAAARAPAASNGSVKARLG